MPAMTGNRDMSAERRQPEHPRRRNLHGRRHGRPLRSGRQRLLDELLPEIRLQLPPRPEPIDPVALFAGPSEEIWLEIGFGSGEHLAWQAEHNPAVGIIGAEHFVNGVASLLRYISDRDLRNVRIWQGDGRDLLDGLPDQSLDRVFVLFPDPWRKGRHHNRRLIQGETLERLSVCMKDGGELRIATDHPEYLRWILERTTAHPAFRWLASRPADWRRRPSDWPPTRYEEKAILEGCRPAYLRFRRWNRSRLPGPLVR